MKKKILYSLALMGLFVFVSCGDYGDLNLDPNNPSQADTRFLFTRASQGVTFAVYSSAPAPSVSVYDPWSQLFPQYFAEIQNIQYTEFSIVDFNTSAYYHTFLRNIDLIIKMNEDPEQMTTEFVAGMGSNNNQIAAAKTLKAFYYMHLSDVLGMMPFTEALKGDEDNFTAKYDTQKDIYTALDAELIEAYGQFDQSGELNSTYDILYNGDISKWKKLNASIRMLMAIKLSDVEEATGKTRFAKAYTDGGIVDNGDNLVYQYLAENANMNPLHDNIMVAKRRDFGPSKTIVDALLSYNDPRVASYAEPSPYGTYDAVPFGVIRSDISLYKGKIALFNPKMYEMDAPITIISASRMLLVQAEAAVRGWISGSATDMYADAIEQSFELNDVVEESKTYAAQFAQYGLILAADDYLAQPSVALTGTKQEMIDKIAMQRWLNGYNQNGIEAWSDWRRLNVPKLKPGPAAAITHIPYRRHYYLPDYETNMDNYKAAISVQGPDNFDTRVWWDVADNN